jgi:hypothetical protein
MKKKQKKTTKKTRLVAFATPAIPPRNYKERRLRLFHCKGMNCQVKLARSFKKRTAEQGLYRRCRKGKTFNPNQKSLFGQMEPTPEDYSRALWADVPWQKDN